VAEEVERLAGAGSDGVRDDLADRIDVESISGWRGIAEPGQVERDYAPLARQRTDDLSPYAAMGADSVNED
jgi:hypothetical protein